MSIDDDLAAWIAGLDDLFAFVAGRFFRVESRLRARSYVRGLLAPLASKNGWTLAEATGMRRQTGCRGCSMRRPGTQTGSGTTCVPISSGSTRSAATMPGTDTSRWPCWPTPTCPSRRRPPQKPWQRPHPRHARRGPPSPGALNDPASRPQRGLGLVPVAPEPATTSEDTSSITKSCWSINPATVLALRRGLNLHVRALTPAITVARAAALSQVVPST